MGSEDVIIWIRRRVDFSTISQYLIPKLADLLSIVTISQYLASILAGSCYDTTDNLILAEMIVCIQCSNSLLQS